MCFPRSCTEHSVKPLARHCGNPDTWEIQLVEVDFRKQQLKSRIGTTTTLAPTGMTPSAICQEMKQGYGC